MIEMYEMMMIFLWSIAMLVWIFVFILLMTKKKFNLNYHSLMVFWGMILVFNLSLAINQSTPFQWIMVGIAIGSLIMLYLSVPHIINLHKTIKRSFKVNKELIDMLK